MTEVLLKELSNSDIDWMIATGLKMLALYLSGKEKPSIPYFTGWNLNGYGLLRTILWPCFCDHRGETSGRELTRLTSGEIVGEIPFVGAADHCQGSRKIARDVDSPAAIGGESAAGCRFYPLYRASPFCFQTDCRAYSVSLVVASLFKASWGCAVYFGGVNDSDIDWMTTGSHKIAR